MRKLAGGRIRMWVKYRSNLPTTGNWERIEPAEVARRLKSAMRVADKYWPPEKMGEGVYFDGALAAHEYITASFRNALGMDTTLPAPKEES